MHGIWSIAAPVHASKAYPCIWNLERLAYVNAISKAVEELAANQSPVAKAIHAITFWVLQPSALHAHFVLVVAEQVVSVSAAVGQYVWIRCVKEFSFQPVLR